MTVRIGTNIAALQATRRLSQSVAELGRSFERLSTGLRINRASDDAAGLAIADRLRADVRISNTARRNINDALSMINIASGTLNEQSTILQRLVELAEQSANGTYSGTQRLALDNEYQQLVSEFGRLGDTTSFNGIKLLHGNRGASLSRLHIQAGLDGSSNSLLSLRAPETGSISGVYDLSRSSGFGSLTALLGLQTLDEVYQLFDQKVMKLSVVDNLGVTQEVHVGISSIFGDGTANSAALYVFRPNSATTWQVNDPNPSGVALLTDAETGQRYYNGTLSQTVTFLNGGTANVSLDISGLRFIDSGLTIEATQSISALSGVTSALDFTSLRSSSSALAALTIVQNRIAELAGFQGVFGASASRLESALSNIIAISENSSAAESRIRDADVAVEAAQLTRLQILQQVGTSILANAAQQPALAIRLLAPN